MDHDDYCNELIQEDIYYNFDVKKYPNGIYHVLVEASQYGGGVDYWGEYDEGVIEVEYKVYPSLPLYDYLANKDDILAEAEPEAEELVDRYVYIQHTVQKRFKKETKDDYHYDMFGSRRSNEVETVNPLLLGHMHSEVSSMDGLQPGWFSQVGQEE